MHKKFAATAHDCLRVPSSRPHTAFPRPRRAMAAAEQHGATGAWRLQAAGRNLHLLALLLRLQSRRPARAAKGVPAPLQQRCATAGSDRASARGDPLPAGRGWGREMLVPFRLARAAPAPMSQAKPSIRASAPSTPAAASQRLTPRATAGSSSRRSGGGTAWRPAAGAGPRRRASCP